MKHYTDLTEKEKTDFADKLETDLEQFFSFAREKYNLCDVCLHNAVVMMCENYIGEMTEDNGVRH